MSNEWRAVLAALANADARSVYAEVVLGLKDAAGLAPKKRDRAMATLHEAGLVRISSDGELELIPDAINKALSKSAEPRREGVHRFVRNDRIEQYPARPDDRFELLRWVVERAVEPGHVLTELEVNEKLERFHPDVATLRRYLVDEGLLLRTPSGSSYTRG